MDPADWQTGQWKQECRLLNCSGKGWPADGFHPAAAVIDRKRGVQHIFIYSGHVDGPSGVFRITRTLDTPTADRIPRTTMSNKDTMHFRVAPKSQKSIVVRLD